MSFTLIFDLDDTLYNQQTPFNLAYHDLFQYDLDIDALYARNRYYNNTNYSKVLNKEWTVNQLGIYRIEKPMEEFHHPITKEACQQFQNRYAYYQAHLSLSDEMKEMLLYCKQKGIKTAILSNGLIASQKVKLDGLEMNRYIDHIYVSEAIGYHKPDRRAFDYVVSDLHSDKKDCYYVGDSLELDMMGARQASLHTIYMNRRHKESIEWVNYEVTNDLELLNLIKKLGEEYENQSGNDE